jgi:threonine aldolase
MEAVEIGWAQKGEDAQVNRLERVGAELAGQEAALFVFTASLANLLALIVGTRRGDHVILEADMHMVWIEGWNLSYICGLYPRLIATERGELPLDDLETVFTTWRGHARPRPTLVGMENPHNDHGGTTVSVENIVEVAAIAHRHGARVHMDGARLHNVAVSTGRPIADYTRHVDTVTISLNKGLGAPFGALLCGSAQDVEVARTQGLRWLGASGMHRGGMLAAAALYALEHRVERLAEDHRRARLLADGIRDLPSLDVNHPETNQVKVSTAPAGIPAAEWARALEARGLQVMVREPNVFKAMIHSEVDDARIADAIAIVRAVAGALALAGAATAV